ncbi:MAG TPA: hypothetical protein VF518_05390 [Polyangia bacterium]
MHRFYFSLLFFLWSRVALGAVVAIVRPPHPTPVMVETLVRLQGELISVGFETELVESISLDPAGSRDGHGGMEAFAAQRGLAAIIAVVGESAAESVEVWVFDRSSGRSSRRTMPLPADKDRAPDRLAIRALEWLRAGFLEIDLAWIEQPDGKVALPPRALAAAGVVAGEAQGPGVGIEIGGAGLFGVDGVGPALLPLLRVGWTVRSWLVVQVALAGFGTRPTVEAKAGNAKVTQQQAVFGAAYSFRGEHRLRPFLSLSAGFLRTSAEGHSTPPNLGQEVTQWSALIEAGAGARIRLTPRFYTVAAMHAQLAEPYMAVRIVGRAVATSGRPNLLLTLALGAWL